MRSFWTLAAAASACLILGVLWSPDGFRIADSAPVAVLAENPLATWAKQLVYPLTSYPLVTTNAPQGPHIFTRYVLPTGAPEGVGTVRVSSP